MPAPPKPIQEQFGQVIIDAVNSFARTDLLTVGAIEAANFPHIGDPTLRRRLAETLYGARWIYKLGLALLVKDVEQIAHVRAQLIDYAAICEGVLLDMVDHAFTRRLLNGQKYRFRDPDNRRYPLNWNPGRHHALLSRQSFFWLIAISEEEGIITPQLARRLDWLRDERNRVHIRARTHQSFLGTSRNAFGLVMRLVDQTSRWKRNHP